MTRASIVLAALVGSLAIGTGIAVGATPVQGSVVGPVTAVKGKTFTLTTPASLNVPKNRSTVTVVSATVITEQKPGTVKSVKAGLCASALGTRNSKGVVAAQRITLTKPVKGACNTGFGGRGPRPGGSGSPPSGGGQSPPGGGTGGGGGGFGGSGNFGFAFGTITSVKGSTLTVKGTRGGTTTTTTVTVSAKTSVDQTLRVKASAIKVKLCAFVRGTSPDKGVTVKAQSISLSQPTATGCTTGFRQR
jgi:hypothetical protein